MSKVTKVLGVVVAWSLKIGAALVALAIPLLGAWVGSSLAAFSNEPTWVALLCGLLAFPLLPLLWDYVGERRRKRRLAGKDDKERFLTFFDRMVLRTLSLNIVFLGALLLIGPATLFTALSARGDWMLDGQTGSTAETTRSQLFKTVDGLEWAFDALREQNEFAGMLEDDEPPPDRTGSVDSRDGRAEREPGEADEGPDTEDPEGTVATPDRTWPFEDTLHPAVSLVPEDAKDSIEEVARFLVSQEEDPFQKVKALHDWVANHVAYDVAFLELPHPRPAGHQTAERVFETGLGVCAGYANLLKAFGDATDIDIRVVVGDTREGEEMRSGGHAWNAVNIEDRWYLMDATWDAGPVGDNGFTKAYKADYFLPPARVFIANHFPDDEGWQLLGTRLSRAEFLRAPNLDPAFFEHGFELQNPNRSQVTVNGDLQVRISNPRERPVMVSFVNKESGVDGSCTVVQGTAVSANCTFPNSGLYTVILFQNENLYGTYHSVGSIEVVNR